MTHRQPLPSRPIADPRAVVLGPTYRITVLTDGLVRLEHSADGVFEDRASTFALNRELPVPDLRVIESDTHVEVLTDRFHLVYDRSPFSTSGLSVSVLGGVSAYHSVWRYGEDAPNLGGTARTLDMADGAIPLEPGVVSREGYAVIDDSRSMVLDGEGWVAPRDGSRTDLYVFAYGHDHRAAIQAFYAVSGRTPVLPRFALGNWWSRYHRYTTDTYSALLDRFAAEGLPFSVAVIDMDWHVTDVDPSLGSGWTGYTWNRSLFPDPPAFLASLHERGLRVTLNVHPADGVRPHEEVYLAMCAALGREPGDAIPFDVTDREFLDAYFDVLHRGLEDEGVDFWWLDWQSGPHSRVAGIDPLWMLNHFHFLDSARDGRRPLTFSRYAGPGSHRYPVGFSGDTVISWASLEFQPYFTATASNIGYGWWSHDIGGHMFGAKDDELATRWLQLGVFSPILRLHSGANAFTTKEPWTYEPAAQAVMTEHLRLRHRLLPYLHTMNHRAAHDGRPLVEPLYHAWPNAREAYEQPNQYVFGSELVVAPLTSPADPHTRLSSVRAWLPAGTWVDVFTGLVYDGGRELLLHRDLSSIPVLAPAGAIVPLDAAAIPGNDPVNPAALEVWVVVGADGSFTLVEDDDTDDAVVRTALTYRDGTFTVHPAQGAVQCLPATRTWTVTFLSFDGSPRVPGFESRLVRGDGRVSVTVDDVPVDATLTVEVGAGAQVAENDVAGRLFTLLDRARIGYDLKTRIHQIATSDAPLTVRASHLQSLELDPPLATAVGELLFARA
ncbi:glycoside hydrolase family 31 protein [Cellulomonas fengjieae]|uniref:Glycoside hydrolase n=1 Tax=Cellulomonas fengjieae TaxID=2819978 RepID=A0ABS3SL03_9CELL|nr:TIM-barrel domain-containing protein [Cellulomonas fengjieae]MBO3086407.1 glycoside hydrolase [Cellulomonas fengjieae]QVI66725.1 glycoside hydrolase [Cellulomonas fengjieae]